MTIIELPQPTLADGIDLVDGDAYSLYKEIHKGIRFGMFHAVTSAGALDVADDYEVDDFLVCHGRLLELLHGHHHHEDHFVQPLVEEHAPELGRLVLHQHGEVEGAMERSRLLGERLRTIATAGRPAAAHNLYLDLTSLVSAYLAHQLVEETQVMPALLAAVPADELFDLDMELRASIAPPEMAVYMQYMLPAMNVEERVAMLGGMAMAPPEVFAVFKAAAQSALSADDYGVVARRLGLS